MSERWVFGFEDIDDARTAVGGDWEDVRALLGGKGANLADMAALGIPVPPGFTITTRACNRFAELGNQLPEGLWVEIKQYLERVMSHTARVFGGTDNPLLVAVRSGAKFSMPGMMDTVLNV
ncbi:MAG: pyruvate,orthophosphate dikinase, partial [Ilumatobacter sp.]